MGRFFLVVLLTVVAPMLEAGTVFDPDLMRHETLIEYCNRMKQDRLYKKFRLEDDCVMKVSVFQDKVRLIFYSKNSLSWLTFYKVSKRFVDFQQKELLNENS